MPKRSKPPVKAVTTPELNVPKELLDQLVKGPMTQGDLESMFRSLKKAVIERAMSAEMSDHLGYRQGENKPAGRANQRNGTSGKTVITDDGPVRIEVPRDRVGSYEPQIIGKHERRFTGFDQKIIAKAGKRSELNEGRTRTTAAPSRQQAAEAEATEEATEEGSGDAAEEEEEAPHPQAARKNAAGSAASPKATAAKTFCAECGEQIAANVKFCPKCGAAVK